LHARLLSFFSREHSQQRQEASFGWVTGLMSVGYFNGICG
jgi:hypothetical protein